MTPRGFIWTLSALGIAGVHFIILYGFTALACARGFGVGAVYAVGWTVTLLALAAALLVAFIVGSGWRRSGASPGFAGWMVVGCAAVAGTTIALVTLPLAMVPICD